MRFTRGKIWLLIAMTAMVLYGSALAEEREGWILCQPDSYVNARWAASSRSDKLGRLELGDRIRSDGVTKNGFVHCIGLTFESTEGWVHAGYIVWDEPSMETETWVVNAGGRTACRKYVDGPRRCWAKNHSQVTVFAVSSEWAVTNRGFIRTKYIEPMEEET